MEVFNLFIQIMRQQNFKYTAEISTTYIIEFLRNKLSGIDINTINIDWVKFMEFVKERSNEFLIN
jgi:hypothetical protein